MQRTKKIKQQGMMINTLKNEKSEMDQRVEQLSAKIRIQDKILENYVKNRVEVQRKKKITQQGAMIAYLKNINRELVQICADSKTEIDDKDLLITEQIEQIEEIG